MINNCGRTFLGCHSGRNLLSAGKRRMVGKTVRVSVQREAYTIVLADNKEPPARVPCEKQFTELFFYPPAHFGRIKDFAFCGTRPKALLACRLGRCLCFAEVATGNPHLWIPRAFEKARAKLFLVLVFIDK